MKWIKAREITMNDTIGGVDIDAIARLNDDVLWILWSDGDESTYNGYFPLLVD